MAKAWSYIQRKTEDAAEALVIRFRSSYLTGIPIFKGACMTELTTPRLSIKAERATPERIGGIMTGNWTVMLSMEIVSHYTDDTRTDHQNRCGELDDIIMLSDIETEMRSLINDWWIQDYGWRPEDCNTSANEGEIITTYAVTVYCCPSVPELE